MSPNNHKWAKKLIMAFGQSRMSLRGGTPPPDSAELDFRSAVSHSARSEADTRRIRVAAPRWAALPGICPTGGRPRSYPVVAAALSASRPAQEFAGLRRAEQGRSRR